MTPITVTDTTLGNGRIPRIEIGTKCDPLPYSPTMLCAVAAM